MKHDIMRLLAVLFVLVGSTPQSQSAEKVARLKHTGCTTLLNQESPLPCYAVANISEWMSYLGAEAEKSFQDGSFAVYTTAEIDGLVLQEARKIEALQTETETLQAKVRLLQDMLRQMATTQDGMMHQIDALKTQANHGGIRQGG